MNERQKNISQPIRFLYLVLYIFFLFVINELAFGQWLPLVTSKGLWFYTGAAALILGSLLVTPYFTSPANAISYLVTALIAVFAFDVRSDIPGAETSRWIVIGFCLGMLAISAMSIVLKDAKGRLKSNFADIGRILSDTFANPRFIYAIIIIYALWQYHIDSPKEMFFISLSGILIISQQPLENFGDSILRISKVWKSGTDSRFIGRLVAYQTPNLMLIRKDTLDDIPVGSCLLISDKYSGFKVGMALGVYGRDEGVLLRALEVNIPAKFNSELSELVKRSPEGLVSVLDQALKKSFEKHIELVRDCNSIVGIVAPETTTERLYFEVIEEKDIEQGRLVDTFVGNKRVVYQVLDGLTKEEIIQQKNTYGYARGEAAQIGIWHVEERKFAPCSWIPKLNAPVFIKSAEKHEDNRDAIGYLPSTNYVVSIKSIDELVTHNTAILGILGVGKSMLSIELIERMIYAKIKVICLDLTNQYIKELPRFINEELENEKITALQEIGRGGKTSYKRNQQEGGSKITFAQKLKADLLEFMHNDDHFLKIINPSQYEVWRQDSKMFDQSASMMPLTPTEIAQIVSEATLEIVQQDGMTDRARVCLVYEEAHSLIPEWNSIVADGDKAATNGTSRAILQGRKYGLGCLLITQRTANVTKTILNQCNTIFAMRTFDDTGKEFLSNYWGSEYASKLPSLTERHAIFYGRASSCENPVMIRLNDRKDFLQVFYPPQNIGG
jgi:uncharacterized protein